MFRRSRLPLFLLLCLAAPAAIADNGGRDPWQGFNRRVFAFNDWFDTRIGTPVARGYQAVTSEWIDVRVTNVFRNLGDVENAVDFALQGEGVHALDALGRVLANSSLGVGGLFDVASAGKIPRRDTDFGVTLGKWGVGSGPYLVVPFLGPSTVRDVAALPVDWALQPLPRPWSVVTEEAARNGLEVLYLVDQRADLLRYEEAVIGDRYAFLRDIYLQNRDFDVGGAAPVDPFLDDEGDEDEQSGDTPEDTADDASSVDDSQAAPIDEPADATE